MEGHQDLADGSEFVVSWIANDWHDGCSGISKESHDGIGLHYYFLWRCKGVVKIGTWVQNL